MATTDRDMQTRSVRLLRLEAEVILSCLEARYILLRENAVRDSRPARQMELAGQMRTIEEIVAKIEKVMSR